MVESELTVEKNYKLGFASDNYSGICPVAAEAFAQANQGADFAYGDDSWSNRAKEALQDLFDIECEVFFVFNGTAANSLALASLCQSYHSVICHEVAHIETDECGAPEFASNGSKILLANGQQGKLDLGATEALICKRQDIHYPKPKVLSVTQATELGTVYSVDELRAIRNLADKYGLRLHMDGARFANAIASLGVAPAEVTWKVGVDVLCFSGTKNGLPYGEAIVFFNRDLSEDFAYRCKQAGQLASKMRFITAPWDSLVRTGTWLTNAQHANSCATYLAEQLDAQLGLKPLFPVEANGVFVELGAERSAKLAERGWHFYTFIGMGGARFLCHWDSSRETIDEFIEDLKSVG